MARPLNFQQKTLMNKITEYLIDNIIEGNLKQGERLIEQELQKKFNTSRSPIRESIRVLSEKGLVVNIPRKGTYIRKISKKDVNNYFYLAAELEALAARLAIPNLKTKDIEKMDVYLSKMKEAAKKNSIKEYVKYHNKFNDTFIAASQNDLLIGIIRNLKYQMVWFGFHKFFLTGYKEYILKLHSEILNLFKEKNAARLEALTKEHVFFTFNIFLKCFENEKKEE
jgi:DNA-binding GntR family transcriptional regulator